MAILCFNEIIKEKLFKAAFGKIVCIITTYTKITYGMPEGLIKKLTERADFLFLKYY